MFTFHRTGYHGMTMDDIWNRFCEFSDSLSEMWDMNHPSTLKDLTEFTAIVNALVQVLALALPYKPPYFPHTPKMGRVTMRNADGTHVFVDWHGLTMFELCDQGGTDPALMTHAAFLNHPDFTDAVISQSRRDSEEYGIYQLSWSPV
jgi:hypothetical protein